MAVSMRRAVRPAGRPKIAADFSGCADDDEAIEKRETFFRICRSLSYREKVSVANGLGVHYSTVERWNLGVMLPNEVVRAMILNWFDKGKPLKRLLQCESLSGLS